MKRPSGPGVRWLGWLAVAVLLLLSFPSAASRSQALLPGVGQVLVAYGDHNYPPYEFLQDGVPTGFNVALLRAIAEV